MPRFPLRLIYAACSDKQENQTLGAGALKACSAKPLPSDTPIKNFLNEVYEYIFVVSKFLNRNRNISTSQLNALLRLHLKPINVIISHGSITIPNLEAGFPLRCFQRLSIPDIATQHCLWQDS